MKHRIPLHRIPVLNKWLDRPPRVAVVRLSGVISTSGRATLNDATIGPVIERAFAKGAPKAVALLINSPGGSPVQSALIAARISRLAKKHSLPVYAFVEDVAASGGYWLACAAEEIHVDAASIVGSIGVISSSFGFDRLIESHGIERRVYTSGDSKSQLDPFKPENPEDIERLKLLQSDIHDAFKDHVRESRGTRLGDDPALFTGAYWTGKRALDLGLVDGIGHLVPVMQSIYGDKVRFTRFGVKRSVFARFGLEVAQAALSGAQAGVQERSHWARFGL
ncbi:S49 family peptidase [Aquimixticola soesokkakensis]|nr:S49 family peptidase [Aquimixticola soesokkakensis]